MCPRLMVSPTKSRPASVAPTCAIVPKKSCQARMSVDVIAWADLPSTRRHADRAVEAHAFAIEIAVPDHLERKQSILRRISETRRKRHLCAQRLLDMLRCALQERRIEQTGQDRVAANAFLREIARDDQRDAGDAGFRRRVGRLSDLAILCGDGCRVDDRATLSAGKRLQRQHACRSMRDAAIGTDEIDLDDAVEILKGKEFDLAGFLVARGGLGGVAGARAIDKDAFLPDRRAGLREAFRYALFAG